MKTKLFSSVLISLGLIVALCMAPANAVDNVSAQTELQFIEVCSGVKIDSKETAIVASSYCLGRLRGYAESHQLTSNLYRNRLKDDIGNVEIPNYQVFCISPQNTDKQLYEAVLAWVVKNPKTFTDVLQQYGVSSARIVTFTSGLAQQFTCVAV